MTSNLTPGVLGYLACLVDQNGSLSYSASNKSISLNISKCGDQKLRDDLAVWTGGVEVKSIRDGQRRGCTRHCKTKHIHYVSMIVSWRLNGTRAYILLWNLEPYLRTWSDKYGWKMDKYRAEDGRRYDKESALDMERRGWELPPEIMEAIEQNHTV